MNWINAVVAAFAMFSRLPMPKVSWGENSLRYALAAFPLVGIVIGVTAYLWDMAATTLLVGPFLRGAGFMMIPLLITGGIHMDGFCDTIDALASHADKERKQAILKDPHIGSFAVIATGAYLILFSALASELAATVAGMVRFASIFVISRSLSGLAVTVFPCARENGLGRTFRDAAAKKAVVIILGVILVVSSGVLVMSGGWPGVVAFAFAAIVFGYYYHIAEKKFGGNSGDLAGWFLQTCELVMVAALVFVEKIVALL